MLPMNGLVYSDIHRQLNGFVSLSLSLFVSPHPWLYLFLGWIAIHIVPNRVMTTNKLNLVFNFVRMTFGNFHANIHKRACWAPLMAKQKLKWKKYPESHTHTQLIGVHRIIFGCFVRTEYVWKTLWIVCSQLNNSTLEYYGQQQQQQQLNHEVNGQHDGRSFVRMCRFIFCWDFGQFTIRSNQSICVLILNRRMRFSPPWENWRVKFHKWRIGRQQAILFSSGHSKGEGDRTNKII